MKFNVFGDLHYSENYLSLQDFSAKREAYFEEFIRTFFDHEADYYVSIGDLTNFGSHMEFAGIYALINKYRKDQPFIHTIGNHDMYSQTRESIRELIQQDNYFAISDDQYAIIVLDTNRERSINDWSGIIDDTQLLWLDQKLQENADKSVIVFAHHPVYDTTLCSTDEKASIIPEIPVDQILAKHKKHALYVCGHNHADSIVQKDNWTFAQIAAVLDQPSIRKIEITPNKLSIKSVSFNESFRQKGAWIGARMNHFNLCDRGWQGLTNREIEINF